MLRSHCKTGKLCLELEWWEEESKEKSMDFFKVLFWVKGLRKLCKTSIVGAVGTGQVAVVALAVYSLKGGITPVANKVMLNAM